MALKHRITINITDSNGNKSAVLKGADRKLPTRLVRWLFGDYQQIYLLSPGQTVESVNVSEVKEGGNEDVKNERTGCRDQRPANCGCRH